MSAGFGRGNFMKQGNNVGNAGYGRGSFTQSRDLQAIGHSSQPSSSIDLDSHTGRKSKYQLFIARTIVYNYIHFSYLSNQHWIIFHDLSSKWKPRGRYFLRSFFCFISQFRQSAFSPRLTIATKHGCRKLRVHQSGNIFLSHEELRKPSVITAIQWSQPQVGTQVACINTSCGSMHHKGMKMGMIKLIHS